MTARHQIDAVLFDLDGTLLDTAPDMAAALNRLLLEQDRAELPFERLRPVVSHGSLGLLRAGFGADLDPEQLPGLTQRFLEIYAGALAVNTTPFEGAAEVLDALENAGTPWGIVTNKPGWLTQPVLEALELQQRAGCVVSGDTLEQRKPHPAPLHHAAKLLGQDPRNCIYVGDAERDIQAGRAAGMVTLVASYGYIESHETPETWNADGSLSRLQDLKEWLTVATAR
ncbi:MAG: phosphoglycolate phosphatase [Gammaproteobacteria bacterium]|nr:phosphoglycolate phosphatase [Gammaproteobacteria bacterium]NNF61919.1 phosphoglycolate phosphatase [Gammaproteobacteria bacterium]NNM19777.1 phosphoglycolate phosphatase [Gammaproteobacteria bacterium]